MRLLWAVVAIIWLAVAPPAFAQSPADTVRAVLAAPDSELSYELAKRTFDALIAPEMEAEDNWATVTAEIDQLANAADRIAAGGSDVKKLKAARQVIYEAGAWNANRPFVYDHDDPYGQDLRNKLLATYLDTRRGNCVSMPIFQLILAERLGLNVSLSTAPLHVFMRYTNPTDVHAMLTRGSAHGELPRTEFIERFPNPQTIPPSLRPRFQMLVSQNAAAFRLAEAWG